jgi:hypothetical protein
VKKGTAQSYRHLDAVTTLIVENYYLRIIMAAIEGRWDA